MEFREGFEQQKALEQQAYEDYKAADQQALKDYRAIEQQALKDYNAAKAQAKEAYEAKVYAKHQEIPIKQNIMGRDDFIKWASSKGWAHLSATTGGSFSIDGWMTPAGAPVDIFSIDGAIVSSLLL